MRKRQGSCLIWLMLVVSLMVTALAPVRLTSAYWQERIGSLKEYSASLAEPPSLALGRVEASSQHLRGFDRSAALLAVLSLGTDSTTGHSMDDIEKITSTEKMRDIWIKRLHEKYTLFARNSFEYRYHALGTGNTVIYIPAQIPGDRTKYIINIGTDGLDQWHILTQLLE